MPNWDHMEEFCQEMIPKPRCKIRQNKHLRACDVLEREFSFSLCFVLLLMVSIQMSLTEYMN